MAAVCPRVRVGRKRMSATTSQSGRSMSVPSLREASSIAPSLRFLRRLRPLAAQLVDLALGEDELHQVGRVARLMKPRAPCLSSRAAGLNRTSTRDAVALGPGRDDDLTGKGGTG
jgi:hypothetical protein